MTHFKVRYYIINLVLTIFVLNSCVNLKHEKARDQNEEESFIISQKIIGNRSISNYELKLHIKQPENSYLFFKNWNPQLHAYYISRKKKYLFFTPYNLNKIKSQKIKIETRFSKKLDKNATNPVRIQKLNDKKTKRIKRKNFKIEQGSWYGRALGETPKFLDSNLIKESKKQLQLYLNSKGYFGAKVNYKIKTNKKDRSKIVYKIQEGEPHIIDSITFSFEDTSLKIYKERLLKRSKIKKNENFDIDILTMERNRITDFFKNKGFYQLDKKSITFQVDSSKNHKSVSIDVLIASPQNSPQHTKFIIDAVIYKEENRNQEHLDSLLFNGLTLIQPSTSKSAKRVLNNQIKIRPNEPYSFKNAQLTQRLLSNLNSFKFVNINYQKTDSNKLKAYINTSNMKKYGLVTEGGVNVNINQDQGLPGPFISASWISRRFLRGYELLELSGLFSFESQPNITNESESYQTREIGVKLQITFPKFLFPFTKSRLFLENQSHKQNCHLV